MGWTARTRGGTAFEHINIQRLGGVDLSSDSHFMSGRVYRRCRSFGAYQPVRLVFHPHCCQHMVADSLDLPSHKRLSTWPFTSLVTGRTSGAWTPRATQRDLADARGGGWGRDGTWTARTWGTSDVRDVERQRRGRVVCDVWQAIWENAAAVVAIRRSAFITRPGLTGELILKQFGERRRKRGRERLKRKPCSITWVDSGVTRSHFRVGTIPLPAPYLHRASLACLQATL